MSKSRYSSWISANIEAAKEAAAGSGIFPEIILSQAIIESAKNGRMPGTELAKKYNNYFGIKASKSWKGATVNFNTGEYTASGQPYTIQDTFRAYSSPAASFKDYVRVLQLPRYKEARKAKTVEAQAKAIQAAGYSTAPDYAEKLSSMARVIKNGVQELGEAVKRSPGASAAALLAVIIAGYFLTNQKAKK